jgi:hypothetical protein
VRRLWVAVNAITQAEPPPARRPDPHPPSEETARIVNAACEDWQIIRDVVR